MCKTTRITTENIEQAKSSLLKRMDNPNLTQDQLLILREQYDYIVRNVCEREGSDPASESCQ